jgi:WXG100 family type VII secretion target
MAGKLRVAYNETMNAANRLSAESHDIQTLFTHLQSSTEALHQSGLRGFTSDAWYKDMHEILLPKTKQLAGILDRAGAQLKSLNSLFQNAEQESGSFFKRGS